MKILGGMLSFGAGTPLVDAGIAVVPGLASQSRVANNYELLRLFADQWARPLELHSVSSDYAPAGAGPVVEVLAVLPADSRPHRRLGRRCESSMGQTISSSTPRP